MNSTNEKGKLRDLAKENDALNLKNISLQNKLESLENQYHFEVSLLKRKNEIISRNRSNYKDFKSLIETNKHLQSKVHKYKLEIIKKNGEINGLIYENKKLLELSLSQAPPPLSSSSQEKKNTIDTVYEQQEDCISDNDGSTLITENKLFMNDRNADNTGLRLDDSSKKLYRFKKAITKQKNNYSTKEISNVTKNKTQFLLPSIQNILPNSYNESAESTETIDNIVNKNKVYPSPRSATSKKHIINNTQPSREVFE